MQTPPTQLFVHAAPCVYDVPVASHVSGIAPLQRLVPAVQPPVHRPLVHENGHDIDASHAVPEALHVSTTLLPAHCIAPGVHVVVALHCLVCASHVCAQIWLVCHCLAALHVSITLPLQRVSPVVQRLEMHEPDEHVELAPQLVAAPQSVQPFDCTAQVWIVVDEAHCVAPSAHLFVQVSAHCPPLHA